jgi:serine/threonine-protein kinase
MVKPSERDPEAATRTFMREVESISQIDHPNVIALYDVVQEDDLNFLVMEYVPGPSLRKLLDAGGMSVTDAVRFACEIARGLGAAHELGVIHRDVKPANVMIDETGASKVVDFGVARLAGREYSSPKRKLVGTLPYMAPEQLRGRDIDQRVDVYALGVMLFEMLTGRRPFEGKQEAALFYQIMNVDPLPASTLAEGLPEGTDAVIKKAMAKKASGRYRSASHMLSDLNKLD